LEKALAFNWLIWPDPLGIQDCGFAPAGVLRFREGSNSAKWCCFGGSLILSQWVGRTGHRGLLQSEFEALLPWSGEWGSDHGWLHHLDTGDAGF